MKKIIHSVFEEAVSRFPEKTCVVDSNREISYQDLNQFSNQIAGTLSQLGITQGKIVGVVMPSSVELVGSMLGIFKSGGIYLPVNVLLPAKKLQGIIAECQPEVLITSRADIDQIKNISCDYILAVDDELGISVFKNDEGKRSEITVEQVTIENPPIINDPNDGNYIFYTSGSTGTPKAILGCHKSLAHFINWEINEFDIDDKCRVSQLASVTFDASLRDMLVPLCAGGTLFIPSAEVKSNADMLLEWLEKYKITLIHTVPSMLRLINNALSGSESHVGETFKNLNYLFLSGEALFGKDVLKWRNHVGDHVSVVNLYGATETTMIKTFYRVGADVSEDTQRIPVGKPMSNTLVAVINDGILCKPGEIGEIYIKTPFVTKGYLFDKALQDKVFVQNPLQQEHEEIVYKTGDLGKLSDSGDLEVLGRNDTQVKVNGIRIELNEVENAILSIKDIAETVVLLHTNNDNESSLVCYYTSESVDPVGVREALSEILEPSMIPQWITRLESLPLSLNGKVDRKALAKRELQLVEQEYSAPSGEKEIRLETIWKEMLNLPRVSRDASFFSIGGTSLKAIQVISRIYKEFNVLLKIADMFDNQTIAQLAGLIDSSGKSAYEEIVPVAQQPFYEVTYAQKRLWILDQLEENQITYNMPSAYKVNGALDTEMFKAALTTVVNKHEILRTTFVNVEGHPKQKVHENVDFQHCYSQIDLSEKEDQQGEIKRIADHEWNKPFDLEEGPLFRVILLLLGKEEVIILLNMHHIISDGWSTDILTNEVLSCYNSLKEGSSAFPTTLNIQFKDFAHWENQQLNGDNLKTHRQFWLKQFEGDIPVLSFPQAKARPAETKYNGDHIQFEFDQSILADINKLTKQKDVTLFMFLLGLVKVLLYRYTGQTDITVGIPVANRGHKDLENQVGFYVNTLAVRTQFNAEMEFDAFMQKIKTNAVNVFKHSIYPIDLLVEDLEIPYDQTRNSLFDVMVQIQDTQSAVENMPVDNDLQIEKLDMGHSTSKFDFTFDFRVHEGKLICTIEYNTDIYEAAFVEKMKNDMLLLVINVVGDKTGSLYHLRDLLMDEVEINQVEQQFNEVSSEISDEY
ncbi:amino acid adenylation domain-containing protein [Fulvivirga sp. 29W222]|uniref:Amino acid adenylation domain-containing protein n=1 Tax=Fulvivirga marina TaxID=2494733 RepID=A0A937G353_9BACT|nr:non-ribosomal peptide synthetase [Fulvivirga marina]MBL6449168.1 amino acid adenylation domain-containing protein [Fulvivirga marina]